MENTGKLLANLSGGREAESINSYTGCSVTLLQNLLVRYLILTILTMYLNFWQTCVTRQVSMVRVFWELWFYFNNFSIQSNGGADLGFWKCSFFVGWAWENYQSHNSCHIFGDLGGRLFSRLWRARVPLAGVGLTNAARSRFGVKNNSRIVIK